MKEDQLGTPEERRHEAETRSTQTEHEGKSGVLGVRGENRQAGEAVAEVETPMVVTPPAQAIRALLEKVILVGGPGWKVDPVVAREQVSKRGIDWGPVGDMRLAFQGGPSGIAALEVYEQLNQLAALLREAEAPAPKTQNYQVAQALETERLRLAACTSAALGNTPESVAQRLPRKHPYWSASYQDVCNAVDREMALRERLREAEAQRHAVEAERDQLKAALTDLERDYAEHEGKGYMSSNDAVLRRVREALATPPATPEG